MRLIDDLLKDDFFRGGFKPQAAKPKFQVKTGGDAKPWGLIAAVAAVVLLIAAGAGWFFLSSGKGTPETAGVETPHNKESAVAAVIPPPMPAAATDVTASAFTESVTGSSLASVTEAVSDPEPDLATTEPEAPEAPQPVVEEETASQSASKPAPKPAAVAAPASPKAQEPPPESRYRLGLPAMGDKRAVDTILAELRRLGVDASAADATYEKSIYRVIASRDASAEEANTIKIKADVFGLDYTAHENPDGSVLFDFGTFDSPAKARKVAAEAAKFGIEVRAGRQVVNARGFQVRTEAVAKSTAEKAAGALAKRGVKASLQEVKP